MYKSQNHSIDRPILQPDIESNMFSACYSPNHNSRSVPLAELRDLNILLCVFISLLDLRRKQKAEGQARVVPTVTRTLLSQFWDLYPLSSSSLLNSLHSLSYISIHSKWYCTANMSRSSVGIWDIADWKLTAFDSVWFTDFRLTNQLWQNTKLSCLLSSQVVDLVCRFASDNSILVRFF